MTLTPQDIASVPPSWKPDEMADALAVLKPLVKRLGELPPDIAHTFLDGTYTKSQWELFVKFARWFEENETFAGLPDGLQEWVKGCARGTIKVEDNGEAVPE